MNKCTQCGLEYKGKRATSLYCSPLCRVKANRKKISVTVTVTEKEVSVTKEIVKPVTLKKEEIEKAMKVLEKQKELPKYVESNLYSKSGKPPFDFCPKHQVFYKSCHC